MEIPFNLRTLIEKKGRVILPGIGVFYKKRIEGYFDENKNSFFPPKEDISFSYNLPDTENPKDFSAKENTLITLLVDKINEAIADSDEFLIEDLGKLRKRGDVIVFEKTVNHHNLNSNFFGLPYLVLPKENIHPALNPGFISEENPNFSLAEQAMSVSLETEEPQETPKSRAGLYFFLIIVILGLGGFAFYQYRPDLANDIWKQINPDTKPTITPITDSLTKDSLDKSFADSIYNSNIEDELKHQGLEGEKVKDSSDISIQKKIVPKKGNIRYEIIISAWRTENKAKSELMKLRANGIDAHLVEDGGLMYKISAATFYSLEEAEKELKRIQEELNPEAFIKPVKSLN